MDRLRLVMMIISRLLRCPGGRLHPQYIPDVDVCACLHMALPVTAVTVMNTCSCAQDGESSLRLDRPSAALGPASSGFDGFDQARRGISGTPPTGVPTPVPSIAAAIVLTVRAEVMQAAAASVPCGRPRATGETGDVGGGGPHVNLARS